MLETLQFPQGKCSKYRIMIIIEIWVVSGMDFGFINECGVIC